VVRVSVTTHPVSRWRPALLATVAIALVVGTIDAIALITTSTPAPPGPLILGGVLSLSLSRNRLTDGWRGRAEAAIVVPAVAIATAFVGLLLVSEPVIGAAAYVAALFLSVWLRRFGAAARRIGSLIALPFITLLIAPVGHGTPLWVIALVALGALAAVIAVRVIAARTGFLALPTSLAVGNLDERPAERPKPRPSRLRPIASTRMAIQLAVAIAAAFAGGWLLFPDHFTWVVLTAFLVCSGNRGRADVLHKSGLRIAGALAGTLIAAASIAVLSRLEPGGATVDALLGGPAFVAILVVLVGVGVWLRELTYAAWALVMTLVITLLQQATLAQTASTGAASFGWAATENATLWQRVLAIVLGAALGLAASWFVLPVRSQPIVRRRIVDLLEAVSGYLADRSPSTEHSIDDALGRLDEIAPPWSARDRIARGLGREPGDRSAAEWMRLAREAVMLVRADAFTEAAASGRARRAVGEARKALSDPDHVGEALRKLRDDLAS
jgi:hypothetical protein